MKKIKINNLDFVKRCQLAGMLDAAETIFRKLDDKSSGYRLLSEVRTELMKLTILK